MEEGRHANRESASRGTVNSNQAKRAPGEWPWWAQFSLALFAMILAALFLIGLLYSVMTAENWMDPGTAAAPSGAWTAMVPVLMGFTTMTISGIFVFMTSRIDRGARAEARKIAENVANKKVKDIIGAEVQSEMKKQLKTLLIEAERRADNHVTKVDQQMEARYDTSDKRMEARISSFEERLTDRFEDADVRIKERVTDADARISKRVADAENRIDQRLETALLDARNPR